MFTKSHVMDLGGITSTAQEHEVGLYRIYKAGVLGWFRIYHASVERHILRMEFFPPRISKH